MGFDINGTAFLLQRARPCVNFKHTLTIGRQGMHIAPSQFEHFRQQFNSALGTSLSTVEIERDVVLGSQGMCEAFLKFLGAETARSIDCSGYEGATDLFDLNYPHLTKAFYTAVIDGGSLEHIFNFPEALKTAMGLVAPHGHFIAITPMNDQAGHGFYQFSPELFYRAFSDLNGFHVVSLECFRGLGFETIRDPADVGERGSYNDRGNSLYLIAQRDKIVVPLFEQWPQQSDYVTLWNNK